MKNFLAIHFTAQLWLNQFDCLIWQILEILGKIETNSSERKFLLELPCICLPLLWITVARWRIKPNKLEIENQLVCQYLCFYSQIGIFHQQHKYYADIKHNLMEEMMNRFEFLSIQYLKECVWCNLIPVEQSKWIMVKEMRLLNAIKLYGWFKFFNYKNR